MDRLPILSKLADGDTMMCRRCQGILYFQLQGEKQYPAALGSMGVKP